MNTRKPYILLTLIFSLGIAIGLLIQPNQIETTATAQQPAAAPPADQEPLELATFMTTLHTFSNKLGFAIQGKNQPLADFYLHEIKEAASDIVNEIPVYDSIPVDQLMVTMLYPQLANLDTAIDSADWPASNAAYDATIATCNACHTASQYGFIHILPASGTPPFNQKFTVD